MFTSHRLSFCYNMALKFLENPRTEDVPEFKTFRHDSMDESKKLLKLIYYFACEQTYLC